MPLRSMAPVLFVPPLLVKVLPEFTVSVVEVRLLPLARAKPALFSTTKRGALGLRRGLWPAALDALASPPHNAHQGRAHSTGVGPVWATDG